MSSPLAIFTVASVVISRADGMAHVWRDGVLTDLSSPSFGNGLGSALAINDAGLIAGTARSMGIEIGE